ncbi:lipopolysaccharide biosynthesis protein [Aridibaculum aurantiacum]|uniref:lipopolysaccharide biosynthesis protein n=1 Tax=Aridibaculum aurantiacum TaxID=2810307 RepID=UPI001A964836|nr:MATE family efflux transporter [Aridibaculum aurantiacum]
MDKKVLRWNFVFQYGWVLTNVFNSILLLPFYIKYIEVTTLGVWLAASSVLNWMTMVDPGIGEVLQQKIAELRGKNEKEEIGKSIGSGLISSSFILFIAAAVGIIFYFCLGLFLKKDISQYQHLSMALLITIIATGLSLVSFTLTGINQGLHNSAQVAISSISANVLFLIVNLVFLFMGYGVMSIAIANLARASFLNIYIFTSLKKLLNRERINILFNRIHFKKFIRIFSFTSASKIISGLSYSIDMVVLARYIAPGMIAIYEINKRPLNLTNTLIGRHSVALMPLISHSKGLDDKHAIIQLINKQFRLYIYGALFVAFMFAINYFDLITAWVGEGKYIGDNILFLLVISNFVVLIAYFMSNMGYALGDIKKNSKFNIIRNLFYGVFIVIAARYYGIIGTVVVSLTMSLGIDLFFFSYRVYKMGYLQVALMKKIAGICAIIIPSSAVAAYMLHLLITNTIPVDMHFVKLLVNSACFTLFFILLLLLIDQGLRNQLRFWKQKLVVRFAL